MVGTSCSPGVYTDMDYWYDPYVFIWVQKSNES